MDFSDIGSNCTLKEDNETDIENLLPGITIRIDQSPSSPIWKLLPLFSENIYGETDIWQIGANGNNISIVTIINNIKNLTNLSSYDLKTARKLYIDKIKEGYFPPGNELPSHLSGSKPMLAKTYSKDATGGKEIKINKFPVSVMKKINGIRAIAKITKSPVLISRCGNLFPHLNHIKKEIENFMRYLPRYSELDGELYSLNLSFSELTSVVKTIKSIHKKHDHVEYWIFDIIEPQCMVWEERYSMLANAYIKYLEDGNSPRYIKILQAYTANNHEEIQKYHDTFVREGYEGLVIRRYGTVDDNLSRYKVGRNNGLAKYKAFKDEEAIILSINNCFIKTNEGFKTEKKIMIRTEDNKTVEIKMRSDSIQKEDVGKRLTIRYGNNSITGIALRDYE
jgi:hypothetical protein